jgi:hypothetical protein
VAVANFTQLNLGANETGSAKELFRLIQENMPAIRQALSARPTTTAPSAGSTERAAEVGFIQEQLTRMVAEELHKLMAERINQ